MNLMHLEPVVSRNKSRAGSIKPMINVNNFAMNSPSTSSVKSRSMKNRQDTRTGSVMSNMLSSIAGPKSTKINAMYAETDHKDDQFEMADMV